MRLMLSYARRRNDKFVYELADILHNTPNFSVWIDRNQIVGGTDWWNEICGAVEGAECIVVLLTPRYLESIYCMAELEYALALNKPILPLMLETLDPFPSQISSTQIDDIRELSLEEVRSTCFSSFLQIQRGIFVEGKFQLPNPRPARPTVPNPPPPPTRSASDLFDTALDYADQGNMEEAKKLLNQLQKKHPNDRLNKDAGEMLVEIEHEEKRAVEYERLADRLQKAKSDVGRRGAERLKNNFIEEFGMEYDPLAILVDKKLQSYINVSPIQNQQGEHDNAFSWDDIKISASSKSSAKEVSTSPLNMKNNDGKVTYQLLSSTEAIRKIIGDPFDWCEVPEGEFMFGDDEQLQILHLPGFAMAKYPITYSQFEVFAQDREGFYDADNRWWRGFYAEAEEIEDQRWKIDDHPRENVSWYEAMAFCRWLSSKLGGNYGINNIANWVVRLPSEFEWEKAARGTDGLLYPYGNEFDKNKANTEESGIGKTMPVTAYPQGASPYGVMDMSGNVWEWCLSNYKNPEVKFEGENISSGQGRVLRGGSFDSHSGDSCSSLRYGNYPINRNNFFGFRLVRRPSL